MVPEGGARGDGNARGPSHAELQSKDDQTEPTGVVASRAGQVLLAHTLLKSDHFPGCQNLKLKPLIDGAPNFSSTVLTTNWIEQRNFQQRFSILSHTDSSGHY